MNIEIINCSAPSLKVVTKKNLPSSASSNRTMTNDPRIYHNGNLNSHELDTLSDRHGDERRVNVVKGMENGNRMMNSSEERIMGQSRQQTWTSVIVTTGKGEKKAGFPAGEDV
jgi:hypothetical protein